MFVYAREAVQRARELLTSMISYPRKSAADYYYTGVRALFRNDRTIVAPESFELALQRGYEPDKVNQHLKSLQN